jgi:hypothetical protein
MRPIPSGHLTMHTVLGVLGNVDELALPTKGWSRLTLRLFDPQLKQWSIYWVNSRDGIMQPRVVGGFNDGVGAFYCDDVDEGRPIRVRYLWSHITG